MGVDMVDDSYDEGFHEKSFDELAQDGLLSSTGVYRENVDLLKECFPLEEDEFIVSVVGVFTLTLALTNKRLVGMMGARRENLTFITIDFSDIDPSSIRSQDKKVFFSVKGHEFKVPNTKNNDFDGLLLWSIKK